MASFATACRLSARLASRRIPQDAAARGFRTSAAALAAQNFTMPALSPTMTEGNISSWKVKEGDSFSAGDVLLEIETDKASMDVEAQDDGVLMKIFQGDGSKAVQVGARIGVIAEPGDDIGQLEIPADEKASAPKKEAKEEKVERKEEEAPQQKAADPSPPKKSGQKAQKQTYPLLPSVHALIKQNGLDESAVAEMTPTGPNGRLLKGDVLAYLGKVKADVPASITARFEKNSHLDLSNIKIAPPAKSTATEAKKAEKTTAPVVENLSISLPISVEKVIEVQTKIQKSLGTFIPLSTFIARATDLANDELPLSSAYKPSADELFNAVLGLDQVSEAGTRGHYLPQIQALPGASFTATVPKRRAAKSDIIDLLAANRPATKSARSVSPPGITTGTNLFSLVVPKAEEKRAKVFLRRVKAVLENEPGRLVL